MRQFHLIRDEDVSGVSGIGIVAEGVEFESGKVVISWLVPPYSLSIHSNMEAAQNVHGHGGKTRFSPS